MHPLLTLAPLLALYLAQCKASLFWYPLLATGIVEVLLLISLICSKDTLIPLVTVLILYTAVGRATAVSTPFLGLDITTITMVEGVLVEDSVVSRNNFSVLRVEVAGAGTREGERCSAGGVISVIAPYDGVITASSEVAVSGRFEQDLFIGTSLAVVSEGSIAHLRGLLLQRIHRRLSASIPDPNARALSVALLLGQSDQEGFLLKDLFLACGTAHVLALSGMHLNFFFSASLVLSSLLLKGRVRRAAALVVPLGYVAIAGPKPSLIRATLFRLLLPLFSKPVETMVLSFLIHLLFCPSMIFSWAALFSYSAFSVLILSGSLPRFPLSTTALAIAATAPGSLMLSGSWNPAGLLFAFPLTILIALAMLLGVLILLVGSALAPPLILLTSLIQRFLMWGAIHPVLLGVRGYVIYLAVLLTTIVAIGYAEHSIQMRRRRFYELGVRIRLTQSDWCAADTAGVRHDQEVWTELPHLDTDEKADRRSLGS